MGSLSLLEPITRKLGNNSPTYELQNKISHYNNDNKQRSLIIRFFLLTLLANTMLLSIDILIQPTECNPLSSQLPQQTLNKVIKATSSSATIDNISKKKNRIQRREDLQQQKSPFSPLIKHGNMKLELNNQTSAQLSKKKQRRTLANVEASNTSAQLNQHQITAKRLKTSSNLDKITSSSVTSQVSTHNITVESTMQQATSNQNITLNENSDMNNNNEFRNRSLDSSDANNNTLSSLDDASNQLYQQQWQRNINSVNGTIDLSQYGQNDVDRLYGDALLVYLKNFNETLPGRREIISVNGTNNQVPIYRSERKATSWNNPL